MRPFSAVLLAAGRSTRMGRDKALLEIEHGGRRVPLWQHQHGVLARAGAAEIFLSARPEQEWVACAATAGFTAVLHDALSVGGPMVGITAALERASHPHVAVLAIDLPRMEPAWFASLLAECAPGVGCVGRRGRVGEDKGAGSGQAAAGGENFFEPLAAIYPHALKWLAWEALVRGEFSLQRLLTAAVAEGLMRVHEIGADETAMFENWNEPANHGASRGGGTACLPDELSKAD
jgi:molybdopterin-guanine dinucleotide biosynthesis protein A